VQSIGTTVGTIYLSQGRADLQFKLQFLGTAMVAASVMIGLKWGIAGVAFCYTLQSLIWVYFNFYLTTHLVGLRLIKFCAQLNGVYLIAGIMALAVWGLKGILVLSLRAELISLILWGALIYFVLLLTKKEIIVENNKLVFPILHKP